MACFLFASWWLSFLLVICVRLTLDGSWDSVRNAYKQPLKIFFFFFFLEYSTFFKSTRCIEKEFANTYFALTLEFRFIGFIKRF